MTPEDFDDREKAFGSNYRAPPVRKKFITLFLGALEDFMLRLLLVAAVVSIALDMGFDDNKATGNYFKCSIFQ